MRLRPRACESCEGLAGRRGEDEPWRTRRVVDGEIGTLARIARPDVGVLVTVGEAHLEKLGITAARVVAEARALVGR